MKKVWTGRYWMTDKHAKKISVGLKKYFKEHAPWNKGLKYGKYDEPASKRFRRDKKYYINELRLNAINQKKKGWYLTDERIEELKESRDNLNKKTGAGRKAKKWEDEEIEYLERCYQSLSILEMALTLERSWLSVSHKLSRLGLSKYNNWTKPL